MGPATLLAPWPHTKHRDEHDKTLHGDVPYSMSASRHLHHTRRDGNEIHSASAHGKLGFHRGLTRRVHTCTARNLRHNADTDNAATEGVRECYPTGELHAATEYCVRAPFHILHSHFDEYIPTSMECPEVLTTASTRQQRSSPCIVHLFPVL